MNAIANSLGLDAKSVRRYLDLLEGAFVVRRLPPLHANLRKRLIRSPKLYLRDTGLLLALLRLPDWNAVAGHPVFGHAWESLCIENIIAALRPEVRHSFYRTAHGAEIDLVLETGSSKVAVEFKASTAPRIDRGFSISVDDLQITRRWVVAPVREPFASRGIHYSSLAAFIDSTENADLFRR